MSEESPKPHPDSPHQRMIDFLAESDRILADTVSADGIGPDAISSDSNWPFLEGDTPGDPENRETDSGA